MLFHPAQLGLAHLDKATLEADKKACKKIGPCGVGKKALYLNSFYIDRRYYLPYGSISRVFKRVAMSQGGFSGKGMFASMAYLVVEYDGGKQKQCNFKDERDVDALLEVLAKEQPNIPRLSAAGEAELARQKAEKAARRLPQLSKEAEQSVGQLKRASDYLAKKPELAKELSAAERRKRAQLQSKPVYKYVALIISLFGVVSAAYGIQSIINHTGNYGIYFALFGFAAIFLFSSYNMMPTAHNNRNAIMKRADRAEAAMDEYIKAWCALKVLSKVYDLGDPNGFVFNMSVGYDLEGIKGEKVNTYIDGMMDAGRTAIFGECKEVLKELFPQETAFIDAISPRVSRSVTVSAHHGCPPDEI